MFILACCIVIPIIMITIGILYIVNLSKGSNALLDFIVPLTMLFSGVSQAQEDLDKNMIIHLRKKCGLIWMISGFIMIMCVSILVFLRLHQINTIIDSLFEVECIIFTLTFITIEYFKIKLYKK